MSTSNGNSLYEIAGRLRTEGMRCNCDLDNWEPNVDTGHSHVCRIDAAARRAAALAEQEGAGRGE